MKKTKYHSPCGIHEYRKPCRRCPRCALVLEEIGEYQVGALTHAQRAARINNGLMPKEKTMVMPKHKAGARPLPTKMKMKMKMKIKRAG